MSFIGIDVEGRYGGRLEKPRSVEDHYVLVRGQIIKQGPKQWMCRFTFHFGPRRSNLRPWEVIRRLEIRCAQKGLKLQWSREIDTWDLAVLLASETTDYASVKLQFSFFPNYFTPDNEIYYRLPHPLGYVFQVSYICRPILLHSYIANYIADRPNMVLKNVLICDSLLQLALGKPFIPMRQLQSVIEQSMENIFEENFTAAAGSSPKVGKSQTFSTRIKAEVDNRGKLYPSGWEIDLLRDGTPDSDDEEFGPSPPKKITTKAPEVTKTAFSPFTVTRISRARTLKDSSGGDLSMKWALDFGAAMLEEEEDKEGRRHSVESLKSDSDEAEEDKTLGELFHQDEDDEQPVAGDDFPLEFGKKRPPLRTSTLADDVGNNNACEPNQVYCVRLTQSFKRLGPSSTNKLFTGKIVYDESLHTKRKKLRRNTEVR